MIVLFIGPTLAGYTLDLSRFVVRPPARQGDVYKAVTDGARVIGIVDGYFEQTAAVWHKEILFALSKGIVVAGAGSMGALRAAECAYFGMKPIGRIANDYLTGVRTDDADVAVLSLPPEFGHQLLSEPRVNIEPTLARLAANRDLSATEFDRAMASVRGRFYGDISVDTIFDDFGRDQERLTALYRLKRVDQKATDALQLITELGQGWHASSRPLWEFQTTPTWRQWLRSSA